jgi:ribonuclease BN (tRNA processing enzyme)
MRIRLLGAHQGDNLNARFMSILVDGVLAIDAGGLTSGLTEEEQLAIDALLITHRHFDHIKDLPGFAHTRWRDKPTVLHCIADTRDALQAHVFNNVLWPALREEEEGYFPVLYREVKPSVPFEAAGYSVLPVEMSHTVPTVGYYVSREEKSFFYTADTRGTGARAWSGIRPDLLIAETTMFAQLDDVAARFGHMTPRSLERELRAFHEAQGYYPRTVCVHINPRQEPKIREELDTLAHRLGAEIEAGYEGMEIAL